MARPEPQSTCWTVIRAAAAGSRPDREEFARRYGPMVRAYLAARWRGTPLQRDLDDASQEVFVECFRGGGALEHADPGRDGGFRPFLFGVVRNVALRFERNRARSDARKTQESVELDGLAGDDEEVSQAFDRAWAQGMMKEALELQGRLATDLGEAARRRMELLRLRFDEGLAIRHIARLWSIDPAVLHHEYATARREFKSALLTVVAFHHPGSTTEVEAEAGRLLDALSG